MGIFSAGASLGAMVRPIMLNKLINGPLGFRTAVRISGGIDAVLLIVANILVRTRLPPREVKTLIYQKAFFKDIPYLYSLAA
jgi:hypothetical protein